MAILPGRAMVTARVMYKPAVYPMLLNVRREALLRPGSEQHQVTVNSQRHGASDVSPFHLIVGNRHAEKYRCIHLHVLHRSHKGDCATVRVSEYRLDGRFPFRLQPPRKSICGDLSVCRPIPPRPSKGISGAVEIWPYSGLNVLMEFPSRQPPVLVPGKSSMD